VALDGVGLVSQRRWPEARRPLERIRPLLAPRSAVVMGVSARGANPGRIILDNLKRSPGAVRDSLWVVHPQESAIADVPCVPSVAELPGKVDLAVVSVPAEGALAAIADLVEGDRAESIILIPGGFAEAGHTELAGRIEDVLARGHAAEGGGPVMVGGNCLGIVSRDQYNTFFLPPYKLPFRTGRGANLAMVSQSGAYLVTFASNYDGVILPRASISFGNQMDLTAADFLAHFNGVDEVDVIACYVEGFRPGDGARFLAEARRARRLGKRVIVFKAGKTALGAQAAASHTASLAGDYAVARSCLVEAGCDVAETLDGFEDLIKTFTLLAGRNPGHRRVGIISNAGFECSTVMDSLEDLELAVFDPATQDVLDEVLPGFAHRTNPIDCTPMTGTDAFCRSCEAILASPAVDAAILSSVPVTPALDNLPVDPAGGHGEDLDGAGSQATLLAGLLANQAKPAVVVVDSGELYDPLCRRLEEAGVPVFRKIDRAARALAAYCRG
jgi:acyl-CoA synthetase (NDP forming)